MAVMTDGPLVGAVTDTEARIWFKTDDDASVQVQYSTSADLSNAITTAPISTVKASNRTGIIELEGLLPETRYYYRIIVDSTPQQASNYPSFTTFAPAGSTRDFSFAVMADLEDTDDFPSAPAPVYEQVASEDIEFVMQIGDFDHRDPGRLSKMRKMHREVRGPATAAGAEFAEHIAPNFPFFHTWDDHDYGKNNGDKTFGRRAEAIQAINEYYPFPDLPNPAGIWHDFSYAQVDVFMLDLRSQRDNHNDLDGPQKSMLDGDIIANGQKQWLENGLLNSTATWKIIVSSVPFNPTVERKDGWELYPHERLELLDFIATNNIQNAILLSADMHFGGAVDDGSTSGLPEIQLPHTNMANDHVNTTTRPGFWSEGILTGVDNAGYLLVTVNETQITFDIKGVDGEVNQTFTIAAAGSQTLTSGGISGFNESSEEPALSAQTSLAVSQGLAANAVATQPNIVLFVTDDQRFDTLQHMANLQQLQQNSTTFNNAFVTTALSGPSRASILSGLYAHNHGVLNNGDKQGGADNFDDSETIATWLRDAGYLTGIFGKYINQYDGSPIEGWDDVHVSGKPDYFNYTMFANGVEEAYGDAPEDYFTDVVSAKAQDFLAASEANDAQPFLMYIAPGAPHKPATPAPRHQDLDVTLPTVRPPSFDEQDVSDKPQWVQELDRLSARQIKKLDKAQRNVVRTLQAVDEAVGDLMDTLATNGELENTIIMFVSDNGLLFGEHRHNEKKVAYEEGIRVPLLVYDGRNPVQQSIDEMVLNIDLAPTIAQMAGLSVPSGLNGTSLVPLLEGQSVSWREDFLIENYTKRTAEHDALRTEQWKYVEYKNGDRELYDLEADPFELESQHGNPAYQTMITEFSARLAQLKAS